MSDAVLIAILLAAFALAIGLVQVLGRLIDSGGRDGWDDEPPDTGGTRPDTADPDVAARAGRCDRLRDRGSTRTCSSGSSRSGCGRPWWFRRLS